MSRIFRFGHHTGWEITKHVLLFIVTLGTTTVAGMIWQNEFDLSRIGIGMQYSIPLLFILSCHEFGHYFAARYHSVDVSLPYYTPFPPIPWLINFGTVGAVIRTRAPITSRAALFDIGIAGPIAGFIASVIVLVIGFMNLPDANFIVQIHPHYDFSIHADPTLEGPALAFGNPLLYSFLGTLISPFGAYVPPMTEMYHYPLLIAGWFGLLVTALNLIPAGQLDGGHVLYAVFGEKHGIVARITVGTLLAAGIISVLPIIHELVGFEFFLGVFLDEYPWFHQIFWPGWIFWGVMILLMKVDHPPVLIEEKLDSNRMLLGLSAPFMFLVCIAPAPVFFL